MDEKQPEKENDKPKEPSEKESTLKLPDIKQPKTENQNTRDKQKRKRKHKRSYTDSATVIPGAGIIKDIRQLTDHMHRKNGAYKARRLLGDSGCVKNLIFFSCHSF